LLIILSGGHHQIHSEEDIGYLLAFFGAVRT